MISREAALFARLPAHLEAMTELAPGLARRLRGYDLRCLDSRAALASVPVLRKPELMRLQAADPPFGGMITPRALRGGRLFMSPGPIWEPQGVGADPWLAARALHAAGFRPGART